ncbi:hypothetical protein GCM10011375_12370 [Hymenobacter qilianensis]|nr:hypothetical protein GCM10011375_12370 [Hymenobacter qilianensis]
MPSQGRNDWLAALALFCNERGVLETDMLSWALTHPALHGHGEDRIMKTVSGIYREKVSDHGTKVADYSHGRAASPRPPSTKASEAEWPTPAALSPRLRPVPAFNENLFPPALRPALRDVAHRLQCPPDWPAVAWMVMMGAVVGNRCGIRPKQLDTGWLEVPNLWGAIVADPSKMKTPTLNAALYPLKELDRVARNEHRDNIRSHEAEAEVLKARKEAIKKKLTRAADKGIEDDLMSLQAQLANLEATSAPVARRYLVNDSTVEKLVELLIDNPRGLLVFRDELTGLLLTWEKQGRETDRQFYLEAWNGTGDYGSDRIGRGSSYVQNCCLSLLGGIQPDKLANYLRQTQNGENDGMTQRFSLLTWPDPRPFKYIDVVPDHAAHADAAELLRRLDALDPIKAGATIRPGDLIPAFHFDLAAQEVFVAWLTKWQLALESSDESPALVQHLAKYRKLFPALALLFHLLEIVSGATAPGPVSQWAAELAEQWCAYFAAHARRIYAYGANGSNAATLGEHISKGHLKANFTARDIQRKGWQGLTDKVAVATALEDLVEASWIRELHAQPASEVGRPHSTVYEANPSIFLKGPESRAH